VKEQAKIAAKEAARQARIAAGDDEDEEEEEEEEEEDEDAPKIIKPKHVLVLEVTNYSP
jgi:Sec-independent protein translocase protein TatA